MSEDNGGKTVYVIQGSHCSLALPLQFSLLLLYFFKTLGCGLDILFNFCFFLKTLFQIFLFVLFLHVFPLVMLSFQTSENSTHENIITKKWCFVKPYYSVHSGDLPPELINPPPVVVLNKTRYEILSPGLGFWWHVIFLSLQERRCNSIY